MSGEEAADMLKKLSKKYSCATLSRVLEVNYLTVFRWLKGHTIPRSPIIINHIVKVAEELKNRRSELLPDMDNDGDN